MAHILTFQTEKYTCHSGNFSDPCNMLCNWRRHLPSLLRHNHTICWSPSHKPPSPLTFSHHWKNSAPDSFRQHSHLQWRYSSLVLSVPERTASLDTSGAMPEVSYNSCPEILLILTMQHILHPSPLWCLPAIHPQKSVRLLPDRFRRSNLHNPHHSY